MGLLEATNLIDPKTIRAMQARYGLRRDGILVGPSPTVRGFQLQIEFLLPAE